jgi:hypothetical protein
MQKLSRRALDLQGLSPAQTPSFQEWRHKNSTVMIPDKGFTKQLHKLDKELEVVWDWGAEKWEIWRFPKGGDTPTQEPFHVMTVQTKDRTYRELGQDILIKLQTSDPRRFSLKQLITYFDEMDAQVQRRRRKELISKIQDITRETVNYQHAVPLIQVPQEFKVRRTIESSVS